MAGEIQPQRCEVYIADYVVADSAGRYFSGKTCEQWHLEGLFVHEAFVEPSVITEKESWGHIRSASPYPDPESGVSLLTLI